MMCDGEIDVSGGGVFVGEVCVEDTCEGCRGDGVAQWRGLCRNDEVRKGIREGGNGCKIGDIGEIYRKERMCLLP